MLKVNCYLLLIFFIFFIVRPVIAPDDNKKPFSTFESSTNPLSSDERPVNETDSSNNTLSEDEGYQLTLPSNFILVDARSRNKFYSDDDSIHNFSLDVTTPPPWFC